ncbi:glutathione S-transferase T3-like [Cornus florida]|uniref:glutathione S-transferase T3-like n=1 Tax=Cornus florida TaxID=4283 RepID=UPI00289C6871|nr:glutathione S-transferase T3-like [Cornus florida]
MDLRHPYYYNIQFNPSNDEFLPFPEENINYYGGDSQFPSHQPSQPSYQPSQTSHQYCGTSVPQSSNSKPPSKQSAIRHNNWTKAEDEALCWAWLSITSDVITGADQSKQKLWVRILKQYKQHIGVPTERKDGGLMNRCSVIQQKISKFFGCMTTIEMNRPSGFSSDDMMIAVKDLFRSQTGGEFKLESCWRS